MKAILTSCFILVVLSLLAQDTTSKVRKGIKPVSNASETIISNTYALVVGISDYQDEAIPDLRFADKDALAFAGYLQSAAGGSLDADHMKVMVNKQATAAQFAIALDWLWEVVKENDRVIIYFSGHGDVERKSITQPGYLLCWDAPANVYMAGGAFNVRDLNDVVSTLSIQNKAKVILITDACRAGKLSGSGIGGAQATASNLAKQFANEIKILSCQPDEYSLEGEQWGGGRGAFSYHLLNGLYGMADKNSDLDVTLTEIDRYLEDNVTVEVAPQNQLPMTVGNGREKLTVVSPEILAEQLKMESQSIRLFASTDSRGIEDECLADADTSIVEMYFAFKESIANKNFLEPEGASADFYYNKLSQESALEPLHSSMRRNYAAALQDDAQQVLNKWLDRNQDEMNLSKFKQTAKYRLYPEYLERAAELLGAGHYMYSTLMARKLYFEGYLMHIQNRNADIGLGEKILKKYRAALMLEPELPYVYNSMSSVFFYQLLRQDSSEHYANRAIELAPSWLTPYTSLAFRYCQLTKLYNTESSKKYLDLSTQLDSTAAYSDISFINNQALYFLKTGDYKKAETEFKKVIQLDSTVAWVYNNLGMAYFRQYNFPEAEKCYLKSVKIDSTNHAPFANLGMIYSNSNRFEKAEKYLEKAVYLDSTHLNSLVGLSKIYVLTDRISEGEKLFEKAIVLDSISIAPYMTLAGAYQMIKKTKQAENKYLKLLEIDPLNTEGLGGLGMLYSIIKRYEEAENRFQEALVIQPQNFMWKYQLGKVYRITEKYAEAEKQLLEALELNPRFVMICEDLGLIYTQTERYSEAEEMFLRAEAFPPKIMDVYVGYAILYTKQDQIEKGYEYLEKALQAGFKPELLEKYSPNTETDLEPLMSQTDRWNGLMKKYMPE